MRSVSGLNNKPRSSNIELLRIIAMLLIVQSHFAVHGYMTAVDGNLASIGNGLNRFFITAITTGNIGNALFMLITGYFLSVSKEFKIKRIFKVVIQVFTYSTFCYVGYTLFFNNYRFHLIDIFTALSPLIHDTYWYFSSYVLIYLFHPFLNILINHLKQKQFETLIIIMMFVWGFVPSLLELKFESSGFLVFCFFYFVGAYIRRFYIESVGFKSYDNILLFDKKHIKWFFLSSVAIWVLNAFLTSITTPFYRFVYMASPLVVLMAVLLFLLFLNIRTIAHSSYINTFAGCMGGIYLLSDNPYVRPFLYNNIFNIESYIESNAMIIYTLGASISVFVICFIVEFVRMKSYDLIEKQIFRANNNLKL